MAVKFANNVSTTLSAAINATQTTISVADASGLPTLSSGDYVYLTIDTDTNSPTIEVVKVTAISSNSLTVVRGQDGTTASSFSNGTKVELRVTAAALDDISSAADTESVSIDGDTMTGALKVSMPHSTTYSDSLTWNEQSYDALKVINGNSTSSADQFSSIFMQASGGGNASARIVLRNDNSGNGRLYFQMRSGAHTGVTQPKMLITDDGYVTISDNATTYNERLFVDGTLRAEDGIKVGATRIVTSSRALQNIASISSGAITATSLTLPSSHSMQKITMFNGGHEWIGTSNNTLELSGASINLNGAQGTGTANLKMGGTTVIDSSRNLISANITNQGTMSSGSTVLTANYTGGSGDYTNVGNPPLKIIASSGYVRVPVVSAHASISIVHNYETGKAVYWGEPSDTGTYYFRGRDVWITDGTLTSGVITATGEGHTFYSSSNSIKFGRNANENIQIIVTDGANKIVATQDSDGDTGHDFILDRVYNASTGDSNFYIRNAGSNQLSIDKNANVTIAGNLTVQGTTTTIDTANLNVEDNNITLNYSTGDSSASANGAGITIQDAVNSTTDATILWNATQDRFDISHTIISSGNIESMGFLQHYGYLYSRTDLRVLNAGANGWNTWATRSNGQFNLSVGTINSSSITATGNLTLSNSSDVFLKMTPSNSSADPVLQMNGQAGIASEGFEIWYDNTVGDVHLHTTYNHNDASIRFHTKTGASKGTSNERFRIDGSGYTQITSHTNSWDGGLRMVSADGTDTYQIHPDNNGYMYVDKNWYFTGAVSIGSIGQYAWHSGNDGSGSGLDADTVDGVHKTGFMQTGRTFSGSPNTIDNGGDRYNPDSDSPSNEHYAILTYGNSGNVTGQFATHFQTGQSFTRAYNTSWSSWRKQWDASNDGSGSGLDADLLDGHDSGSFLRSNVSDNYTSGTLSFNSGTALKMLNGSNFDASSGDVYVNLRVIRNAGTANTDGLYIGYLNSNSGLTRIFGGGQGSGGIYISGSGANDIKYNNSSVFWHAGNDGSGSGLDADLLDGYHETSFVRLTSSSNSPTNGTFAIGTDGSRNFIQSHSGRPLDLNPLGNTVTIGGTSNTAWHAGNDGSGSGLDADNLDGVTWGSYKSTGHIQLNVQASNGYGLRFWNGNDNYKISMSNQSATGFGRQAYEPNSDYNMYFRMASGTNRGFVFQNGTSNKVGIDASGNIRADGIISSNNKQAMNVAHWSNSGNSTGAIVITLPGTTGNYSMPIIEVVTYEYNSDAHTVYHISGHNWSTSSNWYNNRVTATGANPKEVRLGHNGTTHCIIIGTTSEAWAYGHVTVSLKAHPGFYSTGQNMTTGWGISQVTSLSGYSTTAQGVNKVWHSSNDGAGSGLDADTIDGLNVHAGRNNEVNKVVRTDSNGYIQAGWINTTSGNEGTTNFDRIYASYDGYIRYYTKANFGSQISSHINYDNLLNKPTIPSNTNQLTNGAGFLTNTSSEHITYVYRIHSSDSTSPDSFGYDNRYQTFNYGVSSGVTGPLISFGGLGSGYPMQITGAYNNGGSVFKVRTRNGDTSSWNSWRTLWHDGNDGPSSGLDADTVDGLHAHSNTVRQDQANKLVTTDGNGYIQAGWINTTSGAISSTIDKIYASNDGYIRYITPTNLGSQLSQYINYDNLINKPTIPSNTNQLTNGAGFLTSSNDRIYISDTRGANRAPSYYDYRYVQADFTQNSYLGLSSGVDAWGTVLTVSKWASYHSSHRQEQLIFAGTKLARRVATSDSAWSGTHTIWDSSTDGPGSGLDADTLDGQEGSHYLNAANFTGTAPTGSPFLSDFVHLGNANGAGYSTDDGSWVSRLNVSSTVHAKIEVSQQADSMRSHWYAHTGQDSIKFGTSTGHDVELQRNGGTKLKLVAGGSLAYEQMIFQSGGIGRADHHRGLLVGSYNNVAANSAKTNPIYIIGTGYQPTATSFSNMYGVGYAHSNMWGTSNGRSSGWGFYSVDSGTVHFTTTPARTWSQGEFNRNGNKVWDAGNDGAGSGLDADTLDTYEASYFFSPINFPTRTNFENVYNNLSSSTGSGANLNSTFANDRSGTFDCWSGSNFPPSTSHVQGIQVRHSTGNDYGWQLASQYNQPGKMYLRHITNGTFYDWHTLWTSANDGSGSGLDADTLHTLGPKGSSSNVGANQIIRSHSNGYVYLGNWTQVGDAGLFSTTTNAAHFYPNGASTYGTWRINGSKGSYTGIWLDYSNVNIGMYDSGGNGGDYSSSATGGWHYYYHRSNRCMGIGGSTTSSSYGLYEQAGGIYSTGNITAYSDRRIKENIVTIDKALEKVNQLEGVYYNRIDDPEKNREIGFIAQDVNEVAPELVTYAEDVDQYGVKYQNATALLVEAVKTLTQQVKDLQAEIEELKNA